MLERERRKADGRGRERREVDERNGGRGHWIWGQLMRRTKRLVGGAFWCCCISE